MSDPTRDPAARKGSAAFLILAALAHGPLHGYDVAKTIARDTDGVFAFNAASLYPLLYRLEARGWIAGSWKEVSGRRRRRTYRLTAAGKRALAAQRSQWALFVQALAKIVGV